MKVLIASGRFGLCISCLQKQGWMCVYLIVHVLYPSLSFTLTCHSCNLFARGNGLDRQLHICVWEFLGGLCAMPNCSVCLTLCGWGSQWGSGGGSQTRAPQLRGWGSSTSPLGSDFLIPQLPGWGTLSSLFCALVLEIILGDQAKNYFFPPFNNFVAPNSIT